LYGERASYEAALARAVPGYKPPSRAAKGA
jgi:hypothetical protein